MHFLQGFRYFPVDGGAFFRVDGPIEGVPDPVMGEQQDVGGSDALLDELQGQGAVHHGHHILFRIRIQEPEEKCHVELPAQGGGIGEDLHVPFFQLRYPLHDDLNQGR